MKLEFDAYLIYKDDLLFAVIRNDGDYTEKEKADKIKDSIKLALFLAFPHCSVRCLSVYKGDSALNHLILG